MTRPQVVAMIRRPMARKRHLNAAEPARPSRGGTRERVLTEASHLFYTRGIRATSMDDVAERCGILKGSLYYHYASKEAMRNAYLSLELAHRQAWIDALAASGRDPAGALLAVVAGHRAWIDAPGYRGCFVANAAVEFPGDAAVAEVAGRYREHAEGLLEGQLLAAGSESSVETARELLALLHGALALAQIGALDAAHAATDAARRLVLESGAAPALAAS
jgi:AcrR family transcriptional regulator